MMLGLASYFLGNRSRLVSRQPRQADRCRSLSTQCARALSHRPHKGQGRRCRLSSSKLHVICVENLGTRSDRRLGVPPSVDGRPASQQHRIAKGVRVWGRDMGTVGPYPSTLVKQRGVFFLAALLGNCTF
ncbi:MAG: hypothetical protein KatS3mg109_0233 [Pirellulaceae bacterium]|nr:MAG: hypothetical protein KatS3mg109_0233 [Pirellulaceae bacterium]GIW96487.1 MAG: hypothetical protein KatS3mg110_4528 [Pirellulaceae bacterium]